MFSPGATLAADLKEPPVFASRNGVLDLLMIATAKPVPTIEFAAAGSTPIHPTGWVYEICLRPQSGDQCPKGSETAAAYGGVRLALQKGDTLKVRLINRLPALDPRKVTHTAEPGQADLFRNPTNLHTHGLLVEARAPSRDDPTFGDDIFVSIYNSANGTPNPHPAHQHGPILMDAVDYRIDIPKNHPSGLFWFHPHIHGLSLNQVSSGLAGILTIGSVGDYAHGDIDNTAAPDAEIRHLILKDMQVLAAGTIKFDNGAAPVANGEVLNQQDPDFCAQFPASASELRQGSCPGADNSGDDGNNYAGGRWYFTVNGQRFPTIKIAAPDGEFWRLTNASGSLSYRLRLTNDATRAPMIMQLIAVDGVSINLPQDMPMESLVELAGARFKVVRCPPAATAGFHSLPVCIDELVMMPSSRAELWVTYRDAQGRMVKPPRGATGTLTMVGLTMGSGDSWPAVDLAKIEFAQPGWHRTIQHAVDLEGEALTAVQEHGIFTAPVPNAKAASLSPRCKPLPAGHRRRIFFGLEDLAEDDSFGLGYEEIDRNGTPVPGSQLPVTRFDPTKNSVCLPLGPGQTPVHETWELVQLSTENHNFHIHQARFRQVRPSARHTSPLAMALNRSVGAGIVEDNLPLGVAAPAKEILDQVMNNQSGVCSIEQWRDGTCASKPVVVDIPFTQLGEFVYHCHILEHEDGGMMAKIQVVSSPY